VFFTTHDPHFDNMQGFLMAHGFEDVVSVFDYDPSEKLSTLGVPDHVMFDRAVEELGALAAMPFFATLLTSSNHGPWIIPDVPISRLPDSIPGAERLNAFKYSDWALGRFVQSVRSDPRFANTLIIITADNGIPFDPVTDLDPTQFHIPLLLLPPNHPELAGVRDKRLAGQIDILPTVMGLVGLDFENRSYGHDLLAADSGRASDFAIFSEDFRVGYIEGDHFLVWRYEAPRSLFKIIGGRFVPIDQIRAIADSLEERALRLFRSAYMNVMDPPVIQAAKVSDDTGL
jgi:phosphoglycerol transferase MdoB-like AlkP superfamily enzyme